MNFLTRVIQNFDKFPWNDYAFDRKYRDTAWPERTINIVRGDSNYLVLKPKFDEHFRNNKNILLQGITFDKMIKILKIAKLEEKQLKENDSQE